MNHATNILWIGRVRRAWLLGSVIVTLFACADEDAAPHQDHTQDSCEQLNEELRELRKVATCDDDDDCHLFGSCNNAEWRVVATRDVAQASPIYDEIVDRCVMTFDGPVPSAVCRDGMCQLIGNTFQDATAFCGQSADAGGR